MQVELRVDPAPVAPLSLPVIANCDTDSNPQDGCTTFNLSAQTPAVLALQPLAATNYTVTYYTSQADASTSPNGTAPIINTTNYTACGLTKIWVRVQNKNTGCFAVGSFDVQVNTPIVLTTPTLLSVCDDDAVPNNLYTTFNMSAFVGTVAGHTLEFFLDANHTQPILNPSAFVNTIPATQTVFIVATNTLTGCKSYRTLTVVVLPVPTPRTNLTQKPLVSCDITNPNDGYEIFDLTTNAAYIMNGDTNVTLHYYPSKADAIANTNEITTGSPIGIPTAANVNQNVWIRVESNYFINTNNEHCYVLVEQPIKVNPLPLVKANYVYQECDDDTDGFTVFHLNTKLADMLVANTAIAVADCTFAFYEDAALSIPINATNYTNLINPQPIYVVVTHTPTGCKSPVTAITLVVNPKPTITVPANFATCDTDGTNDGYFAYPLDILIPNIIGTQPAAVPPATYSVTFYNSQADAEAGTNPIANPSAYQTYSHIIWIRIENDTTHCYRTGSFETVVEQKPEPEIFTENNVHVLCVSYNSTNHALDQVQRPLLLQINNLTLNKPYLDADGNPATYPIPTYNYQWYVDGVLIPGATSSTYNVPMIATGATRQFTVEMLSPANCAPVKSANFEVIQSGQAVAIGAGYTVTNAFSENQIITVDVEGWGAPTYQYSLDDGPRQTSPIFENVSLGEHIITIWDTKGGVASSCDPLVLTEVQTIDYPHYFTPNGDGINDYWNIVGLSNQISAKIYIFDRQGKLIKQISPQSKGWDGTYNGNLMISTDYWFTVDYSEAGAEKQFKAHFTLKR
jgi:gliding motility-associated-like protein